MKNRSINLIFFLCFSAFAYYEADGQRYNWDHVDLKLLKGQVISGRLMAATKDSLFMLDLNKPFPGCAVTITGKYKEMTMEGTIVAINRSTVLISTKEPLDEKLVYRNQVKSIHVNSYPESAQTKSLQTSGYGYQEVEYVGIHKVGSGGIGAVVGGLMGVVIGAAIGANSASEAPSGSLGSIFDPVATGASGLAGALLGSIVGAPLGAAVGTSNKKHFIHGDQEKFQLLVERISR